MTKTSHTAPMAIAGLAASYTSVPMHSLVMKMNAWNSRCTKAVDRIMPVPKCFSRKKTWPKTLVGASLGSGLRRRMLGRPAPMDAAMSKTNTAAIWRRIDWSVYGARPQPYSSDGPCEWPACE